MSSQPSSPPPDAMALVVEFLVAAARAGEDERAVFQALTERAVARGGRSCSVARLLPGGEAYAIVAYHTDDPVRLASVRERVLDRPLRLDESGFGAMMDRDGPLLLATPAELRAALRYVTPELAAHMAANPTPGQLWVPVRLGGAIVGAVNLNQTAAAGQPLDASDTKLAEALAAGASLLLENALVRGRLRSAAEESDAITEFLAAASGARSVDGVLEALASHAAGLFAATSVVLAVSDDGRWLVPVAAVSPDPAFRQAWAAVAGSGPIAMASPASVGAAPGGDAVLLGPGLPFPFGRADLPLRGTADEPAEFRPRSQVVVPVVRGGHAVAMLAFARLASLAPDLERGDLRLARTLARRAAVALEAASARAALASAAKRSEITASFFTSVAGVARREDVYQRLVEHVLRATGGSVIIYEVSPDRGYLDLVAADPPDGLVAQLARRLAARRLRVGEGRAGHVAASGESYFKARFTAEELEDYEASLPPDLLELVRGRLPPAAIAVPLRIGGEVAGVLFASRNYDDPEPFTLDDFAFVEGLATRATIALEANAARRAAEIDAERDRVRAEALEAASAAGDDVEAMFPALVTRLAAFAGYAWVQELTPDRSAVTVRAWHVTDPALRPLIGQLMPAEPAPANAGSTGEILRTGRPILVPDPDHMVASAFMLERTRPEVARLVRGVVIVPLRAGGRIVGALGLGHVDHAFRGFDRDDVAFLESLGSAVSILLDHVASRRARDAAAADLARTGAILSAMLDASPVAIIAVDAEGRVTFWSKAAERMFGWRSDEVLGSLPPHLGPGAAEVLAEERARLLAGEPEIRLEARRRTRAGEQRDMVVHLVPMRDAAGAIVGMLTVQEDVTERLRLETELVQAQKMETVGRLAGGIAHDMNNLLTAIMGHASLAAEETSEPSVALSVATIQQSAERAAGLTRQLLAFSRRQVLLPTVVDVNRVVADLEPILGRLIGEQIEVVLRTAPETGSVLVDRTQLEQVVLNLAVNARDAMPDGGRLVLSTMTAVFDDDLPHVEMAPGAYVVLSVADTGLGFDDATKAKIFEPFFTTKPVGQGTGLGLSTVYGIVRQSGGHVWVYSEPGRGTTFRIYLPRVEGLPAEEAAPAAIDAGSHGRILLVEDEPLLRELAVRVLERAGFEVLAAAGPAEALVLAEGDTVIDLLLSDVIMPGQTGVALARRLWEMRPDLPVILMSGYAEDVTDAHSVAEVFLAKPFTPDTMIRSVRAVLGGRGDPGQRS